jgi:hypothetical protein
MSALARLFTPRPAAAAFLAVALSAAAGCSGGTGNVTGKITYKNEPVPGGSVQFMSPAGAFVGEIGPDGSYSVSGVPTGASKIAITCQDPKYAEYMNQLAAHARDPKVPKPKGSPDDFNKIPTKYTDFTSSGLTYEVKSGSQTHDIELK